MLLEVLANHELDPDLHPPRAPAAGIWVVNSVYNWGGAAANSAADPVKAVKARMGSGRGGESGREGRPWASGSRLNPQ